MISTLHYVPEDASARVRDISTPSKARFGNKTVQATEGTVYITDSTNHSHLYDNCGDYKKNSERTISTLSSKQNITAESAHNAAKKIQTQWRKFSSIRRQDSRVSRQLASCIGTPITNYQDLQKMFGRRIIVKAYGNKDNPKLGHSAIFLNTNYCVHLMNNLSTRGVTATLKYPLTVNLAGKPLDKPAYFGIHHEYSDDLMNQAKVEHLMQKEFPVFYAVDEKYTQRLMNAIAMEEQHIRDGDYTYGLQYNCNTFVRNVLARTITGSDLL